MVDWIKKWDLAILLLFLNLLGIKTSLREVDFAIRLLRYNEKCKHKKATRAHHKSRAICLVWSFDEYSGGSLILWASLALQYKCITFERNILAVNSSITLFLHAIMHLGQVLEEKKIKQPIFNIFDCAFTMKHTLHARGMYQFLSSKQPTTSA